MADVNVAAPRDEPTDIATALREVLRISLHSDGLVRGLREVVKALGRNKVQLCVLASDCDDPAYVKLVEALCTERGTHLVRWPERKTLGEWAGQCKMDRDGKARKVIGCSSVAITDYGKETTAKRAIEEYLGDGSSKIEGVHG